jgi:hypothetical protein
MKHFIGTRFNLKVADWKTTKSGNITLTKEWLEDRFNLFENYCLPSVKNQSNQNFIWCVFFDIDTPAIYRDKIKIFEDDYINFKPIFIDGIENLNKSFIDFIYKDLDENDDHIITTRLDNDDLIHKDFIDIIQSLYKPYDVAVIDLKMGFQVCIDKPSLDIRLYTNQFNPFISLIENTKNFKTIYARMHFDWKNEGNIISYKKKRLWIELVHKENKVNHSLTSIKKALVFNKNDFGLSDKFGFKLNVLHILNTNLKIDFERYLKSIKNIVKLLTKLPKRARRFLLKKSS